MIGVFIISVVIGLVYIYIGRVAKRNPASIAGYYKLSESQKETLPGFLQKIFTMTGVITIVGCSVFAILNWSVGVGIFMIVPSLVMAVIVMLKEKIANRKLTAFLLAFFITLTIATPTFFIIASTEPTVLAKPDKITITGLYGITIPTEEIKELTLSDKIPSIGLRINGFSLGDVRKGYFLMEGTGRVKLFLSSTSGLYIKIQTSQGQSIFLNFKNADKTTEAYYEMKANVHIRRNI